MTFPCNTKLFPLQPEIKYMSMETIYLGIVIFLFVLAIFDLVVGVSNDAVNFLQSAVGAKAASFKTILFIAGIGVFIGAALSNGMMDIARHGIYQPEHFYFAEIMCILLAVMLTDVVLLDVFNTMGMPTSTTVSLVFELLLQKLGKLQLLRRTGNTLRVFARLGVKPCITDKSFCKIHILCYEDVIVNENKRNHSRPYAKERGFLLIVQLLFCFLPLYTIKMSQIYKKCLILKTVYHIFPY